MTKCAATNCEKELSGRQDRYCSRKCKNYVRNHIRRGKQCKACLKPMTKGTKVVLGEEYCERKACMKKRGVL